MEVEVEYFAILRDQAGRPRERIAGAGSTPGKIYEELRNRHGFTLGHENLRVAVNDEFADWDRALQAGDRIVFIPPVAGG